MPGETVALVLAGGGARGAYEMGVLSVLLPALERNGQRPRLVTGTSVGALNTAFLGSTLHLPAGEVVAEGERIWREIHYGQVLRSLRSLRGLRRIGAYLGELAGLPVRATSILDPAPLAETIPRLVSFDQLNANAADDVVQAAVVTTSASTSRSVVFHTQSDSPEADDKRGIDYVATSLGPEHVQASAAIPVAFPAVQIEADWYFDGGTRLNTPIKPAIKLGADRVVVIGLNSIAGKADRRREPQPELEPQPDLAGGASQLIQAVLVDPLVNDIQSLATDNRLVGEAQRGGASLGDRRAIPYVFVAPKTVDAIGALAAEVFNEHYASAQALLRSPDMAVLGRLAEGGKDAVHGELLSYLFFAPEFAQELLKLGRGDGEAWLGQQHDDGLWRTESPPPRD